MRMSGEQGQRPALFISGTGRQGIRRSSSTGGVSFQFKKEDA